MARRPQERSRCSKCRRRMTLGYKLGRSTYCYTCFGYKKANSALALPRLRGDLLHMDEDDPRRELVVKAINRIEYQLDKRRKPVPKPISPPPVTGPPAAFGKHPDHVGHKPTQEELESMFSDYAGYD